MTANVVRTVVVLSLAGVLPSVAIAGVRPVTLAVAPLSGAAIAALAATCCLATAGDLWTWFLALGALGAVAVIAWWALSPGSRPWPGAPGAWSWPQVGGMALIAAAVVWSLRGLSGPDVGFDARMLWVLRGAWFVHGHDAARAAMSNPTYKFAEPSFPPLLGAASGVGWVVNGMAAGSAASYRLGQIVIGVLNGCALVALGAAILQVPNPVTYRAGRSGGAASRGAASGGAGSLPAIRGGSRRIVHMSAAVVAALLCLAAAGSAGRYLTNGFADAPWVFAAAFAVVFGLFLPVTPPNLGVAAIGVAVAGQIKLEGTATAGAIVVLVALRYAMEVPPRRRRRVAAVAGCAGLVLLAAWPILTTVLHALPDADTSGPRSGTIDQRLHATVHALAGYLHLVPVAAAMAIVGALVLRVSRRQLGLGGDLTLWLVMACNLMVVGGTYVFGTTLIRLWLGVSADRVVLFAVVMALVDVAVWSMVAMNLLLPGALHGDRAGERPAAGDPGASAARLPAGGPAPALDGGGPCVLHPPL